MNRITRQTGIFNMAKMSKTVSRGLQTSQQDPLMMDCSMVLNVINKKDRYPFNQSQENSVMDISKQSTPKTNSQTQKPTLPSKSKDTKSSVVPFKEIEHNLLHNTKPEDYFKHSNTLDLLKRDLHTVIKRNIPPEIYTQFFMNPGPIPHPAPSQPANKKKMPLQPSNLQNLPVNQEKNVSEWTLLMGSFSSQEEDENGLTDKTDSKSMMDTDTHLSSMSQPSVYDSNKPDYLISPSPVTMYPQKMF